MYSSALHYSDHQSILIYSIFCIYTYSRTHIKKLNTEENVHCDAIGLAKSLPIALFLILFVILFVYLFIYFYRVWALINKRRVSRKIDGALTE